MYSLGVGWFFDLKDGGISRRKSGQLPVIPRE
jgi:hypothetical protein